MEMELRDAGIRPPVAQPAIITKSRQAQYDMAKQFEIAHNTRGSTASRELYYSNRHTTKEQTMALRKPRIKNQMNRQMMTRNRMPKGIRT